jgi:hypothetical protein
MVSRIIACSVVILITFPLFAQSVAGGVENAIKGRRRTYLSDTHSRLRHGSGRHSPTAHVEIPNKAMHRESR